MTEFFLAFWRFEVVRIGDQPVHVGQCVIALLIVFVGLWLAKRGSRLLASRLSRLPGIKANALAVIEKLVFYVLALVVVAIALQTVNIPISAFAILGGAFAIGLGFGAQNLFNNFISGLILIIEQPIRVGDLIEVDSQLGHVRDVGARCTRIGRPDGVDLLVPNSLLLEHSVVNWTLSDQSIRTSVTVGVEYGSPSRRVAETLEAAIRSHSRVLVARGVNVLFEDFGGNALVFTAHFWTEIQSPMELATIRSEIRHTIDERFLAAGIAIASPERRVDLAVSRPLDVRLVGPEP